MQNFNCTKRQRKFTAAPVVLSILSFLSSFLIEKLEGYKSLGLLIPEDLSQTGRYKLSSGIYKCITSV